MPNELPLWPGRISTVAGEKGTPVSTEPRVAMTAQALVLMLFLIAYVPVDGRLESCRSSARLMAPPDFTTAKRALARPAADQGQVERHAVLEAAARILGLDVDRVRVRAAAGVHAGRAEHQRLPGSPTVAR